MDMPLPTDAHRQLERFVGVWQGEEQLSPSPWDPEGGTARGLFEGQLGLDGFALIQDYRQERNGAVCFQGHGVYCWDPQRSVYTLHWFDSMGMGANEFAGVLKDDVLTLRYEGKGAHHQLIFDFSLAGCLIFRMENSKDGAEWTTALRGRYTREN